MIGQPSLSPLIPHLYWMFDQPTHHLSYNTSSLFLFSHGYDNALENNIRVHIATLKSPCACHMDCLLFINPETANSCVHFMQKTLQCYTHHSISMCYALYWHHTQQCWPPKHTCMFTCWARCADEVPQVPDMHGCFAILLQLKESGNVKRHNGRFQRTRTWSFVASDVHGAA